MSTAPLDSYEYRAALLEWHQENVGQTQRISLAEDSSTFLSTMREDVLRYTTLLYNRYATTINVADLTVIQQYLASEGTHPSQWTQRGNPCFPTQPGGTTPSP
jgi:hypothetical protein